MTERNWYQAYMTGGERVMWESEPEKRGLSLYVRDVAVLGALAVAGGWGGFILHMLLTDQNVPIEIQVFMTIIIGLWVLFAAHEFIGPWMARQRGLRSASYVITDRCILRNRAGMVDGLLLSQLPEPILTDEKDGRGTIRFWPEAAGNRERGSCRANLGNMAGFELRQIAHAQKVHDLLRSLKVKAVKPQPICDEPLLPIEKDERLLWQGRPDKWQCLRSADKSRLPGMAWALTLIGGFDLLIVILVGWQPDIWVVHLLLLGMALVCLLPCLLPFLADVKRLRRMEYVLTDRRVLRRSGKHISEKRLDRGDAPFIYLAQGKDGTATLMLTELSTTPGGRIVFADASWKMEGFQILHIGEAARVMDAVEAASRTEP